MQPCVNNQTVVSQTSPRDWPVIAIQQLLDQTVDVQLKDNAGNPQIVNVPGSTTGAASNDPPPATATLPDPNVPVLTEDAERVSTARLWMKMDPTDPQVLEVSGEYLDNGLFRFHFTPENASRPGLFLGDIQLLDADGAVIFLRRCYVEIEQNTLDSRFVNQPLSIAEVRLALRDYDDANNLLEDYEFTAREIADCIRQPVDYWNEALPPVAPMTPSNFPYRQNWRNATIACLLKLIARWYDRNYLEYKAAGVQVADRNRGPGYKAEAKELWTDYKEWVQQKKISINIDGAYSMLPGSWTR